jgi:hypothetical protein
MHNEWKEAQHPTLWCCCEQKMGEQHLSVATELSSQASNDLEQLLMLLDRYQNVF